MYEVFFYVFTQFCLNYQFVQVHMLFVPIFRARKPIMIFFGFSYICINTIILMYRELNLVNQDWIEVYFPVLQVAAVRWGGRAPQNDYLDYPR